MDVRSRILLSGSTARISGRVCPEKLSISTVVIVVGTPHEFAALASATTLFFSV